MFLADEAPLFDECWKKKSRSSENELMINSELSSDPSSTTMHSKLVYVWVKTLSTARLRNDERLWVGIITETKVLFCWFISTSPIIIHILKKIVYENK